MFFRRLGGQSVDTPFLWFFQILRICGTCTYTIQHMVYPRVHSLAMLIGSQSVSTFVLLRYDAVKMYPLVLRRLVTHRATSSCESGGRETRCVEPWRVLCTTPLILMSRKMNNISCVQMLCTNINCNVVAVDVLRHVCHQFFFISDDASVT